MAYVWNDLFYEVHSCHSTKLIGVCFEKNDFIRH